MIEYMRSLLELSGNASRVRVVLVDDGSSDATWNVIQQLSIDYPEVVGVKLARNYGHQNALLAGLTQSAADVTISLDADLQDDLSAIEEMLQAYGNGADIVFGVRDDRSSDTFFKRQTALGYYRLMAAMGVDIVHNHADYRLMSHRAIQALLSYKEANLFLRGIVSSMGYNTAVVKYSRASRIAGETSYTLKKMLGLALTGIISFSSLPLRCIAILGVLSSLLALFMGVWVLGVVVVGAGIPGWASVALPISLFSSLQLLSLAIVGEYVGAIYREVKGRPRYFLDKTFEGVGLTETYSRQDEASV